MRFNTIYEQPKDSNSEHKEYSHCNTLKLLSLFNQVPEEFVKVICRLLGITLLLLRLEINPR
jgi:hypothetical protein